MPQVAGVEHRYELVDGLRLHYAQAGPESGDVVLLQHGWPQHWWLWRDLIGPLSATYRVIAPDLRGHGWSEKPAGDYRKDVLMRDLLGLLDKLGIERVRWVGHDWGGYIGTLAALRHPERIERFVCLSIPHPWQRERTLAELVGSAWYQLVLSAPVLGKLAIGRLGFPRLVLTKGRVAGSYTDEEGCLSLPGFSERVRRPERCVVEAMDLDGKVRALEGKELLARAFNHEIDHLRGRLFIEHLSPLKRRFIKRKVQKKMRAGDWDLVPV